MTLVELLVVVTIAVVVFAAVVPMLKSPIKEGRVREASRQLNVMITSAKTRAAEVGRPVGIWIERNTALTNAGTTVYFAETPSPYAGDVIGAKTAITFLTTDPATNESSYSLSFDANSASLLATGPAAIVHPGEYYRISFGNHGVEFDGRRQPVAPQGYTITLPPGIGLPPGYLLSPQSYVLSRVPKKSIIAPLQLPAGVAIDLEYSGFAISTKDTPSRMRLFATTGREFDSATFPSAPSKLTPVCIAFKPDGAIDRVSWAGEPIAAPDSVHLLIGQLDKVGSDVGVTPEIRNPIPYSDRPGSPDFTYHENIADAANLWVTINGRNGLVTTSENAWVLDPAAAPNFVASFRRAREFAQSAQSMGGR